MDNSSSKPMICCSTDWKMKPETREHVLTIETIIYIEYQNEKSPRLDFIGGEANIVGLPDVKSSRCYIR